MQLPLDHSLWLRRFSGHIARRVDCDAGISRNGALSLSLKLSIGREAA